MKTITVITAAVALLGAAAPLHAGQSIAEQGRDAIAQIQAETRAALRANAAPALTANVRRDAATAPLALNPSPRPTFVRIEQRDWH